MIYGADDGGELTLRELRNHGDLGLRPVCFVDDDARRHGTEIHGLPIVAGCDRLAWVVERYRIDKIVIGSRKLHPQAVEVIQVLAEKWKVEVAEVGFNVNWLTPSSPAVAPSAAGGNGNGGPEVAGQGDVAGGTNGDGRAAADLRVAG